MYRRAPTRITHFGHDLRVDLWARGGGRSFMFSFILTADELGAGLD